MSPRTGRPKEANPNIINLTIRINAELDKKLNNFCKNSNMTKGEVVRQGWEKILEDANE